MNPSKERQKLKGTDHVVLGYLLCHIFLKHHCTDQNAANQSAFVNYSVPVS